MIFSLAWGHLCKRGNLWCYDFSYRLDPGFFKSSQVLLRRAYGTGKEGCEGGGVSWIYDPVGCSWPRKGKSLTTPKQHYLFFLTPPKSHLYWLPFCHLRKVATQTHIRTDGSTNWGRIITELVCFLLMDLTALLNRLPRAELTVYNLNQMLPFFVDRLQCRP